jgi:hypothetical protein
MTQAPAKHDVGAAITKLISLHDGDVGVIETIACGPAAIPALHSILFSRDASGLYETRRRAVEALEALRAFDVLRDFLASPREISDPIERTGEDAVINAAAQALGRVVDTRDMPLLFTLVRTHPLAGVIEALGKFRQVAALPYFIEALGDDFTRPAAETAIRKFGVKARDVLLEAACKPMPSDGREASTSVSRRRSVLKMLQAIPLSATSLPVSLLRFIDDPDSWISLWVCRLCLAYLDITTKQKAIARLIALLQFADELLAEEVEDCLVEHFKLAREAVEISEREQQSLPEQPIWRSHDYRQRVFERIRRRISAAGGIQGAPA